MATRAKLNNECCGIPIDLVLKMMDGSDMRADHYQRYALASPIPTGCFDDLCTTLRAEQTVACYDTQGDINPKTGCLRAKAWSNTHEWFPRDSYLRTLKLISDKYGADFEMVKTLATSCHLKRSRPPSHPRSARNPMNPKQTIIFYFDSTAMRGNWFDISRSDDPTCQQTAMDSAPTFVRASEELASQEALVRNE